MHLHALKISKLWKLPFLKMCLNLVLSWFCYCRASLVDLFQDVLILSVPGTLLFSKTTSLLPPVFNSLICPSSTTIRKYCNLSVVLVFFIYLQNVLKCYFCPTYFAFHLCCASAIYLPRYCLPAPYYICTCFFHL
jgi:hypothetical protein